jgi:CheY-like chemotaxis protein
MTGAMAKPGTSVLVVDDDVDIRDSLMDVLADEGYEVACASDGLEAIDYLRSHERPGIILLDWMMPNCNGACFRTKQMQDPTLAAIPVVLLTAHPRAEAKMAEVDALDYVPKPVRLEKLLEVIDRHAR